MHFLGLDVHKRLVQAAVVDADGTFLYGTRFPCTREGVLAFATGHLHPDDQIALEATTNTWALVSLLEPYVARVLVSNPLRTRAIALAKVKTDKVDALTLAQLLRAGFLPDVWRPDPRTLVLRSLTGRRASLVGQRTAVKNRIHALLHQRLIHPPVGDLFGPAGRRWLEGLDLDPEGKLALDSDLRLLDLLDREIHLLEDELANRAQVDDRARLLMTIPGVDFTVAQGVLAALGDVARFPDGDRAASYLGLTPATRQSAARCYHGPITKHGKGHVRWLLVQAAQHLDRHPGPLGVFFRRLCRKKDRNVAVVATARKLVVIAWHMLTSGEPYRYADPKVTQDKLARLRVRATGQRRRGGIDQGAPRPAAYGTGQRTRFILARDDAFAAEGLPPCRPLTEAEARMVREQGCQPFLDAITTARRVRRGTRKSAPPVGQPAQPARG